MRREPDKIFAEVNSILNRHKKNMEVSQNAIGRSLISQQKLDKAQQDLADAKKEITQAETTDRQTDNAMNQIENIIKAVFENMEAAEDMDVFRNGLWHSCKEYFAKPIPARIGGITKESLIGKLSLVYKPYVEESTVLSSIQSGFKNLFTPSLKHIYIKPRVKLDPNKLPEEARRELENKIGEIGVKICEEFKLEKENFSIDSTYQNINEKFKNPSDSNNSPSNTKHSNLEKKLPTTPRTPSFRQPQLNLQEEDPHASSTYSKHI